MVISYRHTCIYFTNKRGDTMYFIITLPDFGYHVQPFGLLTPKRIYIIWLSMFFLTISAPDECYFRNVSSTLDTIFTHLLQTLCQ